jgi:hypothetical protein
MDPYHSCDFHQCDLLFLDHFVAQCHDRVPPKHEPDIKVEEALDAKVFDHHFADSGWDMVCA